MVPLWVGGVTGTFGLTVEDHAEAAGTVDTSDARHLDVGGSRWT